MRACAFYGTFTCREGLREVGRLVRAYFAAQNLRLVFASQDLIPLSRTQDLIRPSSASPNPPASVNRVPPSWTQDRANTGAGSVERARQPTRLHNVSTTGSTSIRRVYPSCCRQLLR